MLVLSNGKPDEFTLKRIERAAEDLKRSGNDVAGCYEIQAICAALRGDRDGVAEAVRLGKNASGADQFTLCRFGDAADLVGDQELAIALADEAARSYDKNVSVMLKIAQAYSRAGHVGLAARVRIEADRIRGQEPHPTDIAFLQVVENIPVNEIAEPIVFARNFVRSQLVSPHTIDVWVGEGDSPNAFSIVYDIVVDLEPEGAAELEERVFVALTKASFPRESDGTIVIALKPGKANLAEAMDGSNNI